MLVIGLPDIRYFGYLILTSFAAVLAGLASFALFFARRPSAKAPGSEKP